MTVRRTGAVERNRFDDVSAALAEIERVGREAEREVHANPVGGTLLRRIEPVQQVAARIELSGPGRLRAGIDVRGDGSSEGFTGKLRRKVIDQRPHESAYDALRRTLK